MNVVVFSVFIGLFVLFLIAMLLIKKVSIFNIVTYYFKNYFTNALKEEDRRFSVICFIFLGLLPYILGILMFFSFQDFFMNLDTNLLFQTDIILLTIFCLFIGFDFKREGKEEVKKELIATLLINVLLIVISAILLLVASSITISEETSKTLITYQKIVFMFYYSFSFKIFVMFFYSLKRLFILSSK